MSTPTRRRLWLWLWRHGIEIHPNNDPGIVIRRLFAVIPTAADPVPTGVHANRLNGKTIGLYASIGRRRYLSIGLYQ